MHILYSDKFTKSMILTPPLRLTPLNPNEIQAPMNII